MGKVSAAVALMVVLSASATFAATMEGTGGADRMTGGTGDDTILAASGDSSDVIAGGAGRDTVEADMGDEVAGDCEKVYR